MPLRKTTEAEGLGESFASPRDDDSFRELARAVTVLSRRDERWDVYGRLGARAGLELAPPSLWLLSRICERAPFTGAARGRARSRPRADRGLPAVLEERGLWRTVTGVVVPPTLGRAGHDRIVRARRERLADLLDGWNPDEHPDLRRLLDQLAQAVTSSMPAAPRSA